MSDYVECPSCGRYVDTHPIAGDAITLRVSHDNARAMLRALEALISEADDAASFLDVTVYKEAVADVLSAVADAQPLRDALHAALYCPVVP